MTLLGLAGVDITKVNIVLKCIAFCQSFSRDCYNCFLTLKIPLVQVCIVILLKQVR